MPNEWATSVQDRQLLAMRDFYPDDTAGESLPVVEVSDLISQERTRLHSRLMTCVDFELALRFADKLPTFQSGTDSIGCYIQY